MVLVVRRAAWLVAGASWLHCTHGDALLRGAGLGSGTGPGQRGEGWSGHEWAGWTRVMKGALCAPSRNEKMQE